MVYKSADNCNSLCSQSSAGSKLRIVDNKTLKTLANLSTGRAENNARAHGDDDDVLAVLVVVVVTADRRTATLFFQQRPTRRRYRSERGGDGSAQEGIRRG